MTTLKNDDKKVFDILQDLDSQFEHFLKISKFDRLIVLKESDIQYQEYSWNNPLDLVWNEREQNAILE